MERDETREAAKEFGEMLRAKLAASRQGLRLEDLTGQERTGGGVETEASRETNQPKGEA